MSATLIWLSETPAAYKVGIHVPLDDSAFSRLCAKMATESGKTVVMAMQIAWQIPNKVLGVGERHRISTKYDKGYGKTRAFAISKAAEIASAYALRAAAVAGCIGMVLESVVSVGENFNHVNGGNQTAKEAAVEVGKDVAAKGAVSFTDGVVVALGAGPTMAAAAPVLVTIGNAVYVVRAYRRISDALGSIRRPALEDEVNPALRPAVGVLIE